MVIRTSFWDLLSKADYILIFYLGLQGQFKLQHMLCTTRHGFFQALFRSDDIIISSLCMTPSDGLSTEQLYLLEQADIIDVLLIAQLCTVK